MWPSEDRKTPSPCRPDDLEVATGKVAASSIDMSLFNQVDVASVKKSRTRGFYEKQNAVGTKDVL
jgi:hypothetical protein